jgi:DNA helicase-2/ATP-dependent DNA helicase PcrA
LIATRTGWDGILAAYSNNDMLLGDEPDRLASHLLKIGGILYAYVHKDYASVIGAIELRVKTINDKHEISRFLAQISTDTNATIDIAIESFNNERLLRKDDRLDEYIENHSERYDAIKNLPLSQVLAYFEYYNDYSPYSTQHGIKGAEFDDVLVVMDNGRWNNYNFKYYFEATSGKESVIKRTERIFYVCCSRAMNNLVIYYPKPTPATLAHAKQLFGDENVMMV